MGQDNVLKFLTVFRVLHFVTYITTSAFRKVDISSIRFGRFIAAKPMFYLFVDIYVTFCTVYDFYSTLRHKTDYFACFTF